MPDSLITAEGLAELADELFQTLEAEETDGNSPRAKHDPKILLTKLECNRVAVNRMNGTAGMEPRCGADAFAIYPERGLIPQPRVRGETAYPGFRGLR